MTTASSKTRKPSAPPVKGPNGEPVVWSPFPGFQTRALQCGAFEALFGGAAGPGKTDVLVACAARYAQHPSSRGLFLRTTYTDLRDVLDRMHVLYPQLGARWIASEKRWEWPGGAVLELGYGETLAQISRYLGREYTNVCYDELGLVGDPGVWTMLMSRVRSTDPTVPLRMRASANPGGPGHAWLKMRFVDATKKGTIILTDKDTQTTRAYVPGRATDNPALPESYWEQLRSLPPALQRALRDGDWDGGLGLFYPEVASDLEHWLVSGDTLPKPMPAWWDFWASYDWGYRHPAVFTAYARDERGHVIVLDTLYQHKQPDEVQAATIRGLAGLGLETDARERRRVDSYSTSEYPPGVGVGRASTEPPPAPPAAGRSLDRVIPVECLQRVYGGHDAFAFRMAHSATPETVADVFDRYGIYVAKANLDRVAGSAAVRRAFLSDAVRFVDTPGNRRLLIELASLVPDPTKPETPYKVDADADTGVGGDDGPDCFRYGMATIPWVPVRPAETKGAPGRAGVDEMSSSPGGFRTRWAVGLVNPLPTDRPSGPEGQFGGGWEADVKT